MYQLGEAEGRGGSRGGAVPPSPPGRPSRRLSGERRPGPCPRPSSASSQHFRIGSPLRISGSLFHLSDRAALRDGDKIGAPDSNPDANPDATSNPGAIMTWRQDGVRMGVRIGVSMLC